MLDIIHFTGLTVLLNDKYKNQTSMHPESASKLVLRKKGKKKNVESREIETTRILL